MQQDLERQIDLYARGELSLADARALAQESLNRPDLFEELNCVALAKAAVGQASRPVSSESNDEILERYVSGRLSPLEERKLAREALNNEQLFDALATHATVEKGLDDATFRNAVSKSPRSNVRIFAIVGSIAAAIALFTFYLKPPAPTQKSTATTAHVTLKPTLDSSRNGAQPILLASQLRHGSSAAPIFRGSEPESRPPRQRGSILAIEEKLPTVNLGSLDGLAKGTQLSVFRDGKLVGSIVVTTIFRDYARGRIDAGETIRVGDEVRTGGPAYLSAVLQQVDALTARGDLKKALDVAEKALAQLENNGKLLERIAALEYQTGALDAALRHYDAAAPQEPEALNSLAALYLLRGDYQRAEARLNQAGKLSTESLNNLGVAAELRGDFQKAARYYGEALRAPDGSAGESRKSVNANLARVKGLK